MAYRMALGKPAAGFVDNVFMDSRRTTSVPVKALGSSGALSLAFSPDRSLLVVGTASGIEVYRTADWSRVEPVAGYSGIIVDMAFSPDGSRLVVASSGTSGSIRVYDTATWAILSGALAPTPVIGNTRGCHFSPDGSKLAVYVHATPYLVMYNTSDWSRITVPVTILALGSGNGALRFSNDGTKLALGNSTTPYIHVYDITNMSSWTKLSVPTARATVIDLAWSFDDAYLGVAHQNATGLYVELYTVATWARTTVDIPSMDSTPTGCAFTPDGKYLAIVFGLGSNSLMDRSCYFIDVSTGLVTADTFGAGFTSYTDVQFAMDPPRYIRGTVRDVGGNPVARKVRAYLRSTGDIIGETMSNATTGNYELPIYRGESELVDLQFLTADGELLNDLFFARASTAAT